MSSKTKHQASFQAVHARSSASGTGSSGPAHQASTTHANGSHLTNGSHSAATTAKRQRPRYQTRRGLARWDRLLLLVAAAVVALLVGTSVWGQISIPRGTVALVQTSYNFGDVPIGGGDITTKFPLTVQGDARAIDITST